MRNKLAIAVIAALATYLIDHRVYLIIVNTLVPLILMRDLLGLREQIRLFVNDGDPVELVRVGLDGITINGRELVGLKVINVAYTFDTAFEEALAKARALIRLLSKYRAMVSVSSDGNYVIIVDRHYRQELVAELERLGIRVIGVSGFELANALRMRVRRRSLARLPILLALIPVLIAASAYVLLAFPVIYIVHSVSDFPRRKFVVKLMFSNEVVHDLRATMVMDSTMIRAETASLRGQVTHNHVSILLMVSSSDRLREWVRSSASRTYSRFLMFRHVKYFLNYKEFENTLRRIQQGEDVYSLYLASTSRFSSSFKWRRILSVPISRLLNANYGSAWSMELNLVPLMPYSLHLTAEERGLAVIGRDVDNREVYWSFTGLSPHVLIIGPTGSGKTTLAMSIAYQVKRRLKDRVRLVVIDPHGHTAILGRLINARIIDLSKGGIATNKSSIMIESIRMANPLLSIGVEGALLRMAGIGGDGITGINELVRRLDELSRNNLILKDAFYSLFNVLAPIINYYNSNTIILDVDDLLNDDAIFMMGSITNNELIRYLAMLILLSISNKAISECPNPPCSLRYLVIIDEAHNVLKLPSELKILGLDDPVERMVRELRKYGVAFFILLQPPIDMLDEGILGNAGVTIVLSGNSQYVSHVVSSINGLDSDDSLWLLSGQYRALIIRQGEPRPIRLSRLYVPGELMIGKRSY